MQWTSPTLLLQLASLGLAFVLCALIGLERQRRQKSAGIRTHALVGLGSAVFTVVSAYGFSPVLSADVRLDPSRIAAQIVSGIGFLGAGVIFVKRGSVSGLTTAASIWVSAAVGMACAAGAPVIAIFATFLDLVAMTLLTTLGRWISPALAREGILEVVYRDGHGALREILEHAARRGYDARLESFRDATKRDGRPRIEVKIRITNDGRPVEQLVTQIANVRGVRSVRIAEDED